MSEIKACLFDLDGVIVDTAKYHYEAWKKLANEKLGFDLTEEQNEQLKGISRMKSLDIMLEMGGVILSQEKKEEYAAIKNEWYKELIKDMSPDEIYPGATAFLDELKENGIKIGLGSASKNAMTIIRALGIAEYFEAIIDGNKVTEPKPHPEIFLNGAKELNIPAENCAVFEDAVSGVQSAINGNMYSIGVGSPDVLGEADMVISGLHEMDLAKLKSLERET